MKIKYTNQKPPVISFSNEEVINVKYSSENPDILKATKEATLLLSKHYNSLGMENIYIHDLTIGYNNIDDIINNLSDIDDIYRLTMGGGRFGDVAIIEDEHFSLEANIVVLPVTEDIIYEGYTAKELFDQYHTFFTSPTANEIAEKWMKTELEDHCVKHEITTGGQPFSRNNLDLFIPKEGAELKPLLIHIHGGYWQYTQKDIYMQIANSFTREDVIVANLNYPQAPDATYQEMIESVKKSVRYLYKNAEKWGIDRKRISIAGHSSGAHLTACMGIFNWKYFDPDMPASIFKNVIPFSGGYDKRPYIYTAQNYQLKISESDLPSMSPCHMPCHRGANFTLYVGSKESSEYISQTEKFYQHLLKNKLTVDRKIVEQGDHFSIIDEFYTHNGMIFNEVLKMI